MGPLTDMVTTINLPAVSSADFAEGNFLMEWGVSNMLSTLQADIFVRRTVKELLFDGYDDAVMDLGSTFSDVKMEKFGYFYKVRYLVMILTFLAGTNTNIVSKYLNLVNIFEILFLVFVYICIQKCIVQVLNFYRTLFIAEEWNLLVGRRH